MDQQKDIKFEAKSQGSSTQVWQQGQLAVKGTKIQGAMLGLALFYTIYFARTLLMPVVVALMLALLLSPLVTFLKRFYIPRTLSAVLLIAAFGVPFGLLGVQLAEPTQKWLARVPEISTHLSQELRDMQAALAPSQQAIGEEKPRGLFGFFRSNKEQGASPATEEPLRISERLMQGALEVGLSLLSVTPVLVAQLMTVLILVLFLLVFGPRLYQAGLDALPQIRDKRKLMVLVSNTQRELSRYIVTVSAINFLLGCATAGALALQGVDDAVLWGVLVGLLNYAPYVGPIIGMGILAIVGLEQYGLTTLALLPTFTFFLINLLEAQFVTPTVLGAHMRLNPLVLMVWLIIWGWLWGAVGVLLAVPLLVCLKLASAQLNIFAPWVKLVETRA